MQKKGVHIQIVNSILDYSGEVWGLDAKRALLKISKINLDELEGVQNYIDQEIFYKLLDTIKYDLNRENNIKKIGAFCAKNIIEDSSYLHPILSQGNPLKFLRESESVFSIFFPGCNFKIIQMKTNRFLLNIPLNKKMCLSLFIQGFLEEIIVNFSKSGRLFIREKFKDMERNNASYQLKYVNIRKVYENAVIYSVIFVFCFCIGAILLMTGTPAVYFAVIEFFSVIAILFPINIYIENKKNNYNRNLIKELNALEKVLLGDKEVSALEILNLKASITKLNEFGDSILGENDLDNIIRKVNYDAKILLGSENSRIFFYDKNKYLFYSKDFGNEIKYFSDEGIIGLISKMKKPLILNDPSSNPFYTKEIDGEKQAGNLIAAPILDSNDELIAIIELSDKIERTDFNEIDLSVLTSICNYASLALQKYIMLKSIINEEHKRVMENIADYFYTGPFMNFLSGDSIPDFEGKNLMAASMRKFLMTFNSDFKVSAENKYKREAFDALLSRQGIKLEKLTDLFDDIDDSLIHSILQILISNSIEAGTDNGRKFECEIFYSDEIRIPENIRNRYKISIPVSEWNSRKNYLGAKFSEHLSKSYPLLEQDIMIIEKSALYRPKIIYTDKCGGIQKELEEKIFYPFFSTKKDHAGIGLNLLSKIMNETNGFFEFENLPGNGVNFYIYLQK